MGWWILASDAVPDGEIGRVWEIMKIWILSFCGSGNRNYTNYLLETYCLHRYEASKDFSNAMFNNWLINLRGHKYIECDWVQEDFNKWLEEMVEHKGGDFDDHFYRHTLAPNIMHFLRMKEKMETAFDLTPRGKTHGSRIYMMFAYAIPVSTANPVQFLICLSKHHQARGGKFIMSEGKEL
ncbi:hypothetical protein B0H10DRAFT_1970689 [Mycena sp. CBHHK59/15]|nr:hypothetical protein B0H10DRAFT_1970689 [Mycena sp. CBHHK59/15]